jgi:hypothetical protein
MDAVGAVEADVPDASEREPRYRRGFYIGPIAANDPTSSTLNFPLGDDRANAATVALGAGGTLSVTYAAPTPGQSAQVIFDVTGYFTT